MSFDAQLRTRNDEQHDLLFALGQGRIFCKYRVTVDFFEMGSPFLLSVMIHMSWYNRDVATNTSADRTIRQSVLWMSHHFFRSYAIVK